MGMPCSTGRHPAGRAGEMAMADGGRIDAVPETALGRLFDDRADADCRRRLAMREASLAWLDLAINYSRDCRPGAVCVSRYSGARLTNAQLERVLAERSREQLRLTEMVSQLDTRIAVAAQEQPAAGAKLRSLPWWWNW
jgi:hypothetical protein